MLSKAVQQHNPAPVAKQSSLSQTLFPSSPLAGQDAHRHGSQHKPYQPGRSSIPEVMNVLKPSASSVVNGPGIARTNGLSNLLKRTASQAKGLQNTFNSHSPFADIPHYSGIITSQDTLAGSGKVESLHEAVYFDENDFDDDADLDLGVEDPMQKRHLSASKVEITLPVAQETPSPADSRAVASSATLAWSSSPLQNKATPPNARSLRRAHDADVTDLTQSTTTVAVNSDLNPRPSKRRTIPWLVTEGDKVTQESCRGLPAHVQKIVDRNRANKAERQRENGEFTPLPKNEHNFQYSWNKTASAMKEEQKKLRQANKKLIKNNDASDESLKQAISAKKRKKLESVFLSEEQQRVLKFVVEDGKSVFFTGSAGTAQCWTQAYDLNH